MSARSPRSPNRYGHRAQKAKATALPRGEYRGSTFIDTDGTEYTVSSGILESQPWPEGREVDCTLPARIHLPRVR